MAVDAEDVPLLASGANKGTAVLGKMHFLAREAKYAHEKPYTLRYTPAPESGLPQTNIARVEHPVVFRDWRGRTDLPYDECGFGMVTLDDELDGRFGERFGYDDYEHSDRIEGRHAPRVLEAVRAALGAQSAELVDYVVRRRHAAWPVSTGEPYAFQQPASRAHIDHTHAGAVAVIREARGAEAEAVLSRRWQLVNAWHPLRGPLVDWPLAVCDARTVDFARDTMAGDVVDRHQVFENTQVHFDARQAWYYLQHQMPDEVVFFKNADSREPQGASPGVPHAAFDNPLTTDEDVRRESIEMRILVVW
ncbi:methyltransferase [Sporothrix brasiliensis 5110]|uniref:Methyltransferase n=1 Tax=Sporothrix brasiliensis 5110 TaxID=1398154 RepID=A0A0C2EW25_9PEZI|nr:methyltransferase [Sporothrix brasiliensis 5110]KIH90769.1 methyltransferase [Sporothrix brasiliensis 5110]